MSPNFWTLWACQTPGTGLLFNWMFVCCCCDLMMFYDWCECVMNVLGTTKHSLRNCNNTWQSSCIVYCILPPTPAIIGYAIGLKNCQLNGSEFVTNNSNYIWRIFFITALIAYTMQRQSKNQNLLALDGTIFPRGRTRLLLQGAFRCYAILTVLLVPTFFGGRWPRRETYTRR